MVSSSVWPYVVLLDQSESSNKSPELRLNGQATSEHVSALLPFITGRDEMAVGEPRTSEMSCRASFFPSQVAQQASKSSNVVE